MRLRELVPMVFDTVVLYEEKVEEFAYSFTDLYKGKLRDVPAAYLDREVRVVGAKRKDILDIELWRIKL